MMDLPCILMALTVWVYWTCVGAMIVRVRRRTRKLSGIVPSQRVEQFMWLVWAPLVVAWMSLPYLAATRAGLPWGLPAFAQGSSAIVLRWVAAAVGLVCLGMSIECWLRMGKNWRMAVTPDQQTELVTSGLYGMVRHPIYALSMLLMLCTLVVAPTLPVAMMASPKINRPAPQHRPVVSATRHHRPCLMPSASSLVSDISDRFARRKSSFPPLAQA